MNEADYDKMTEQELRTLKAKLNQDIRELREEVLRVQAAGDRKQQERYAREREAVNGGVSAEIQSAMAEAESIVHQVGE